MTLSFSIRNFFLPLTLIAMTLSCRKLVETAPPENALNANAVFATDANAEMAIAGIYDGMMNNLRGPFNANISVYSGLSSDELVRVASGSEDSFYLNRLSAGNFLNTNLYTGMVRVFDPVNSVLDGLAGPNGISAVRRQEMEGEAKFNRAFIYFYLVNLYGDVPLVTSSMYSVNPEMPRTPVAQVYQQIISDLEDAQRLLPVDYITTSLYAGDRTRPNRAAAMALLARVWLYRGQWALAEGLASSVIGDSRYQLEPDLDEVFKADSKEAIWQLQPLYKQMATADGSLFLPVNDLAKPVYKLTDGLLNSIEAGDQRLNHWTKTGRGFTYPFKYKLASWATVANEYEMVLRLGEMYLVRGEARAREGDLARALADLNVIRRRAGLAEKADLVDSEVTTVFLQERRVELMTEWGHRWFDLKRTNEAENTLKGKAGWKTTDTLYPIPASEMQANPKLAQNPGY